MRQKHQTYLAMAALLPLALSPAQGQDSTPTDEVVVTASSQDRSGALKMGLPLIDVPQSVSIIGMDDIKQRGLREIGDIVRYTPGINTSQGEGHRDAIVFRGVRSTADFFLDGARDDVQYYRPLYNIEQVEVLRGPNALLFGRGGTGGALNRVSKKAVIGGSDSSADITVDSFGGYNLATDVNMPTGQNAALRINAFVESLENDRDFYDGDRFGVNPTMRIAMSAQTTLDLSLELMDHERFIDRGIPTNNNVPVDSLRDIVFGSPTDNTTTLEATILRGSVTHKYSDTRTGVFTLHYGDYEKMYQNLYAQDYSAANDTVTLDGYRDPTERTNMVLSGYVTDQFMAGGMTHNIIIGGEYIDTSSDNLRFNSCWSTQKTENGGACDTVEGTDRETFSVTSSTSRLGLTQNSDGDATSVNFNEDLHARTASELTVTSLFIQDQIGVTDNLQVLLGARLDNFDISVRNTQDLSNVTTQSREDEEISPRLGLIYKPKSTLAFYAGMSESFLPRSGEQFKSLSETNALLDPDVYENTEFGVKWEASDALNVNLSIFDSEQTKAERDSVTAETSEVVGLSVNGYELEVKGNVSDKTSFTLGYTSLDSETRNDEGEVIAAREIPETMYSVFVESQANERLTFGIGLTYQDQSFIRNGETEYLPDYTRVDASLSYAMDDDMTLRVNIENLTDEEYYPHAHTEHQVSVGDPMNAQISLTQKF